MTVALLLRLAPYIIAGALLIGGVWYVYEQGVSHERNSNAGQVLRETEEQRQNREDIERGNRSLSDRDALDRLRPRPRD